jgi:hypothetical protein
MTLELLKEVQPEKRPEEDSPERKLPVQEPERRLKEHRDLFLFLLRLRDPYRLRLCLSRRLDKPPGTAGPGESQVASHRLDATTLWL